METKPVKLFVLLTVALIGALALAVQPAETMERPPPRPVGYAEWTCPHGAPAAWIRADVLMSQPAWFLAALLAHELEHVRFMGERYSNCEDYQERQPELAVESEARAFCAAARAASMVAGSPYFDDLPGAIDRFSRDMAYGYGFDMTVEAAITEISAYCG